MARILGDPPPPSGLTTSNGGVSPKFDEWLRKLNPNVKALYQETTELNDTLNNAQEIGREGMTIAFPATGQNYFFLINNPADFSFYSWATYCGQGTANVSFYVNGGLILTTGASTTIATGSLSTAVPAGSYAYMVVNSLSNCRYLVFSLNWTKSLL